MARPASSPSNESGPFRESGPWWISTRKPDSSSSARIRANRVTCSRASSYRVPSERRNSATLARLFSNRCTVANASPAPAPLSAAAPAPATNPPVTRLMVA